MKILKRLRPHRPLLSVAVAILGVLGMVGGTLSFAGSASASTPGSVTPVFGPISDQPNAIDLLPGSPSAEGITAGATAEPAASWFFAVNGYGLPPGAWSVNDQIFIPIFPNSSIATGGVNDYTNNNYVVFANTPAVVVEQAPNVAGATSPCLSTGCGVKTETNPNDTAADISAGLQDVLVITLNNAPGLEAPPFPGVWELGVINVNYTTGANTANGLIRTATAATDTCSYVLGSSGNTGANTLNGTVAGTQGLWGGTAGVPNTSFATVGSQCAANAYVEGVTVTANNPAVSVLPSAINAPISNIVLTESTLDAVPALGAPIGTTGGFVCVTLSAGDGSFTTTATNPTFTVNTSNEGGTGTVTSTVFLADSSSGTYAYKTGTFTSPDSTDNTLVSQVLFPSTTTPTTYTFSGITVDAPDGYEGPVGATVMVGAAWDAATDECTGGLVLPEIGNENFQAGDGEIEIYAVGQATTGTRIAGSVADQTAEAALEAQWPPTPGGFCVPNNANPDPTADNVGSSVVLATDQNWPDALTGSYLASYYHTGVLLTPTASLSPYAEQAIQEEGISTVFIVGGPLAVSNGVQTTLEHTPQYQCGGSVPRVNALGTPIDLNVIRIDGPVADDTAEAIATYVDSGYVGLLNLAAAVKYVSPPTASSPFGVTAYNDTLGTNEGTLPTVPVRTAILATDNTFQDATSASSLSYFEHLPILITNPTSLSTQALTGLLDLGIQQVIEVGGPIAIADSVNAQLAAENISVLRIAGTDYTDTSVQLADFELNPNVYTANGLNEGLGWGLRCGDQTGITLTHGEGPSGFFYDDPASYHVGTHECFYAALARGDYFADALTSSVFTGNVAHFGSTPFFTGPEPVLLTENPSTVGTYLTGFLNQAGSPYGIDPTGIAAPLTYETDGQAPLGLTVFGGIEALPQTTVQTALNAISAGGNATP